MDKEKPEKRPFAVAFGSRLRDAREAKTPPMTQSQLGGQVGAAKARISQWENGTHMPDLEHLTALCDVLGRSADELLGRTSQPLSAAALEEAKAYDALPPEQRQKWRAMRLTLFAPA